MNIKKKRKRILFGMAVVSGLSVLLAGCTEGSKEGVTETHHRVEDEKRIQKDVEEDGSHRLTDVEQHHYFMKNADSLIDYAQDALKKEQNKTEIRKYVDKAEQEIAFIDNLKLPVQIESEYKTWKKEKEMELDLLKKKLPIENPVNQGKNE